MHEQSLMTDLIRKIQSLSEDNGSKKVVEVKIKLGAFSHISPSHLAEHFNMAAKGTVAEGAQLDVDVSTDEADPNAREIMLESVQLEE